MYPRYKISSYHHKLYSIYKSVAILYRWYCCRCQDCQVDDDCTEAEPCCSGCEPQHMLRLATNLTIIGWLIVWLNCSLSIHEFSLIDVKWKNMAVTSALTMMSIANLDSLRQKTMLIMIFVSNMDTPQHKYDADNDICCKYWLSSAQVWCWQWYLLQMLI